MIVNVGGLLLCNLLFLAAGAGLARAVGAWHSWRGLVRTIGVAYLAGVAAVGVTLQLCLSLGAPFDRWVVITTCVALAGTGFLARTSTDRPSQRISVPRIMWPVVAALVGMVALLFVDVWFQPLGQWDAWSQWTAKAHALIVFHGVDARVFQSAPYSPWNPDYPLLVPSIEASDFSFMTGIDTRAIHVQFFLLYAGFLGALVQLLRSHVREVLLWPFVLAIAVAPAVQVQTASALADVPVAIMFAMAGLFAWRWVFDADRVALMLFAVFAAGAYATKVEGRIYIGALSVMVVLLVALRDRDRIMATVSAVGVALIGLVPWWLWSSSHQIGGVLRPSSGPVSGDLLNNVDRIPRTLGSLTEHILDPTRWLLIGAVIVAAVILAWLVLPDHAQPWFVIGTVGMAIAGLTFAYCVSSFALDAYLRHSVGRVVTGPVLFAVVLAPLLLESVLDRLRQQPRGSEYPLRP